MNTSNEPESIRSDIDVTRQRMDDTIDRLGDRLKPKHLLDEVLGYFRRSGSDGESKLTHLRDNVSHGAESAARSVVGTIKANPVPTLLIGAGVAWLVYQSVRDKSSDDEEEDDSTMAETPVAETEAPYDPDAYYDRPLDHTMADQGEDSGDSSSKLSQAKNALHDKASAAREKLSEFGEGAKEKFSDLRERAGEKLGAAKEKARAAYGATRDRVASTASDHPLELGLGCLAVGVILGLALPTPRPVHRLAGGPAERLRRRVREKSSELTEKTRRVARAGMTAMKEEAKAQGLTPKQGHENEPAAAPLEESASPSDPTLARPAM